MKPLWYGVLCFRSLSQTARPGYHTACWTPWCCPSFSQADRLLHWEKAGLCVCVCVCVCVSVLFKSCIVFAAWQKHVCVCECWCAHSLACKDMFLLFFCACVHVYMFACAGACECVFLCVQQQQLGNGTFTNPIPHLTLIYSIIDL